MGKEDLVFKPLGDFLKEYTKKNTEGLYRPVAVGKYGIRTRESIYSKELASDYSRNKVIYRNTLTVGMGSNQIDIGILAEDVVYSVSPAYHTYKIENINSKYLEYCLNYLNTEMFELYSKKSARQGKSIDFKRWLTHKIPVYSKEKQDEIVNVMTLLSELMKCENDKIPLLEELVKTRFVEMFGNPIENSMGWPQKKMCSCLEGIDSGKSFVCSVKSREGEYPAILKLSAVTGGNYRPDENKALLQETQFVAKTEVRSGDLLFTRKNTPELVGMTAYVYDSPPKLMMPDLIFRLNTKDFCNKIYLSHLINHELFRSEIRKLASGTAKSMSNISQARLMDLTIPLPPLHLQNEFAAFVEYIVDSKKDVRRKLALYQELTWQKLDVFFNVGLMS